MSYLVLARKYRSRNFETLVGQEHVVQALSNALTQGRLHHAYLFTGTRGVGKTSVSRILAKALNCVGTDGQGGITAQPCGVCHACRDIDSGRFVDYVELDAASNRGVEEISLLLDQAVYKPVVGRFKVYMIDEVHMLSTTAFNAMLKTLEEPPEYLKFVLATTDPQKVPPTVLSRCLQFNLRPMAPQTVQEHLVHVLGEEHIEAEPGALRLLARAARGSMRDALSLTDQAIAFGAGSLSEAGVRQMLGAVDRGHAVRMVEALAASDGAALVAAADGVRSLGLSAAGTLEELADLLQQMAVAQAVPGVLDAADPDAAAALRLAGALAADETQLAYSMALHGRAELGLAPDEYSALVMVLLRMLAFRPVGANTDAGTATLEARAKVSATPRPVPAAGAQAAAVAAPPSLRVPARPPERPPVAAPMRDLPTASDPEPPAWMDMERDAELAPHQDAVMATYRPPADASTTALTAHEPAPAAVLTASPSSSIPASTPASALDDRWAQIVETLASDGSVTAMARELALNSQCLQVEVDTSPPTWHLRVERESLRAAPLCEKLQTALAKHLGHAVRIDTSAGPVTDTPARRATAERDRRQREAEQIIHDDPLVQALMAQFKTARIVPGSVKPH